MHLALWPIEVQKQKIKFTAGNQVFLKTLVHERREKVLDARQEKILSFSVDIHGPCKKKDQLLNHFKVDGRGP
jgi:phosphoribosyl-dephospho-CoA transferase